jgi:hypothetical protein
LLVVLIGGVGGAGAREGGDLPALHRDRGARVQGGLCVGAAVERTLVEIAASTIDTCPAPCITSPASSP